MSSAAEPVSTGERIYTLDVIRGFALLGIFIMNMPAFNTSLWADMDGTHLWPAWWDRTRRRSICGGGPALDLVFAIAIFFAVQVPLSYAWLRRFEMGPMEYLWRRLTYGHASLRRKPAAAAGAG
jgi:uncharacterized membrane protein YeiB